MSKLNIIYRITSIPSTNPSPIFQDDKNKLNEICLKSFLNAFSDIDKHIIFLADNCTCLDLIHDLSKDVSHEIIRSMSNINQTMLDSYNLAIKTNENVLFQECDYLYTPNQVGKLYDNAISQLGLVSPYDHLNFYTAREFHSQTCDMSLVDGYHFRTTERNTMTWGAPAELIRKNKDILDKYGYLDGDVWYELKARGHSLWTPIPSFATHMVESALAPGIDWKSIWQNLM